MKKRSKKLFSCSLLIEVAPAVGALTLRNLFEKGGAMESAKPIRTEREYRHALCEAARLMPIEEPCEAGDRLDVLATLIEAYEAVHFPIEAPPS